MKNLTVAVCTYNRAQNLPRLIEELRSQVSPIPFDILFINNNSTDNTEQILLDFSEKPGIELRYVNEYEQGITFARNRAVQECINSDYMLFMDDDELPSSKHMVAAAVEELEKNDIQCVGGKVIIEFGEHKRPIWLSDDLLGFYAEIDYGDEPFYICDSSTPIWTSIIAYDMSIFRANQKLRFDNRYNRVGGGVGGGSDEIMFRKFLENDIKMMYVPNMGVRHLVEPWRMTRRYFWKLHFISGRKKSLFQLPIYDKSVLGIPPFMILHVFKHLGKTLLLFLKRDYRYVRQGMNFTHNLGMIYGLFLRWRHGTNPDVPGNSS